MPRDPCGPSGVGVSYERGTPVQSMQIRIRLGGDTVTRLEQAFFVFFTKTKRKQANHISKKATPWDKGGVQFSI